MLDKVHTWVDNKDFKHLKVKINLFSHWFIKKQPNVKKNVIAYVFLVINICNGVVSM